MNENNAIKINTKNPTFYNQAYENAILKKYQDAKKDQAEEQLKVISAKNQELDMRLGQSSLLENWDNPVEIPDPVIYDEFYEEDSYPVAH